MNHGSDAELLDLVRPLGQRNVLRFHVEIEAPIATVAADAAGLGAAKRSWQVANILAVHPDHADIHGIGNPQGTAHIAGPKISGLAVFDVIGLGDGVSLVVKGNCGQHRTEDFFLSDTHRLLSTGK